MLDRSLNESVENAKACAGLAPTRCQLPKDPPDLVWSHWPGISVGQCDSIDGSAMMKACASCGDPQREITSNSTRLPRSTDSISTLLSPSPREMSSEKIPWSIVQNKPF